MSEQTGATNTTEETTETTTDFEPITSQEALDKIIQSRVARERKRFEDYEELKAKADKLNEIEQATKTEAQKQHEALEQAKRELAEVKVAKTRAEVAAAKGVPVDLLSGGTQEELEASADALIQFRSEAKRSGPIAPVDRTPQNKSQTPADMFAEWSENNFD